MMANWDLSRMSRELPKLEPKVVFIVGEDDKAVHPDDAAALAAAIPGASVDAIPHAGHLAHEEKPEEVCELILAEAAACGVIGAAKPATHRRRKAPEDPPKAP